MLIDLLLRVCLIALVEKKYIEYIHQFLTKIESKRKIFLSTGHRGLPLVDNYVIYYK